MAQWTPDQQWEQDIWRDPFREEYGPRSAADFGMVAQPPVEGHGGVGQVAPYEFPVFADSNPTAPVMPEAMEDEMSQLSAQITAPQQIAMARRMGYDPNGDPYTNKAILQRVLSATR